jgi:hypothetical protein
MIPAAKGLFKANRLMPKALAWSAPQRRLREAELRDSSWSECGDSLANVSGRTDCDRTWSATDGMTIAPRRRDFDGADMSPLTLCSAMASLSHRFASTWNQLLEIAR